MPDTVGIKHYFQGLPNEYAKDTWRFLKRAKNPTWVYNEKSEKTLPNLTLVTTPDGISHLLVQVSLPKLLFGHNAKLPNQTEVDYGLKLMAEYAEEKSGLPFDAETATVSLIHYAYDIHLTEPIVWKMIEKLAKRKLKPLRKQFYDDATIYFTPKSKAKQIRIYPKYQEILSDKKATDEAIHYANGNLRFEYAFREKSSIDALVKKYGLPNSYAQTLLTEQVSDLVISELLNSLNFFDLLNDDKTALQLLREHFPTKKAMDLRGFIEMVNEYGENFYKDKSIGYSKDSYYRNMRQCRKAKVW
ncbi:MAG TPA: phage/plasmid replication protein [Pyrinomonadaceae bacterium]|jgi:II/X family phage/plasmid replication protein